MILGKVSIGVLLCVFRLSFSVNAMKDLPRYFPKCSRNDPQLEQCLLKATETVRPYIQNGSVEFLPPVRPLHIPEVTLEQGTSAVNYKASLKDVTLYGLENYKFTRYDFQVKDLVFYIDVELPQLYIKGNYYVDGHILFAPIQGNGYFHGNITTPTKVSIVHNVEKFTKNGVEYLRPLMTISNMHLGDISSYGIEGLFEENETLAKATKRVIDDNLKVLVEELTPAINQILKTFFDDGIFRPLTQVPFDKLYPPS